MLDSLRTLSPRTIAALVAAGCAGLMAVALYMQYVMALAPCALCMMQRIWVIVVGAIAAIAALHNPATAGFRRYGLAQAFAALIGGGFSTRQVYLQHLPADQVPACGPDFEYMLDAFPFSETLKAMILGTGNCAQVDWSLFGISIAGYTLIAFVGLAVLSIVQSRVTR